MRLSPDLLEVTRELLSDAADSGGGIPCPPPRPMRALATARRSLRMLGYATNGAGDELALAMLAHLVDDVPESASRLQRPG